MSRLSERMTPAGASQTACFQVVPTREIKGLNIANVHCESNGNHATNEPMHKVIRTYLSVDDMKTDEYREWQKLPAHERMNAVAEITLAAYQMKGSAPDVRRLQRTLIHLQRPES
jgi:hypothetical protein